MKIMNTEIKILSDTSLAMEAVRNEVALEHQYKQIGLALNINKVMLAGGNFQQFTRKYSSFSLKGETTPSSFSELGSHIHEFVELSGYEGDKATNAGIYVISKIWLKKYDSGVIFDSVIRDEYANMYRVKKEKTQLHIAVHRLAKGKSEDSFEAGLTANFKDLMEITGNNQLRQLVTDSEQISQLESVKVLSEEKL